MSSLSSNIEIVTSNILRLYLLILFTLILLMWKVNDFWGVGSRV